MRGRGYGVALLCLAAQAAGDTGPELSWRTEGSPVFEGRLAEPARSVPLAVRIPEGLGADDVASLRSLREQLRALPDLAKSGLARNRTAGPKGVSQEVLSLNVHFDRWLPDLRERLLALARVADGAAGWNVTRAADGELAARCLELIKYRGHPSNPALGWHGDGGTLMTMVVMLSEEGSHEGGVVELSEGGIVEHHRMQRPGDVVAWRGWTMHRASPVTLGQREIFAVEFWRGKECATSGMHGRLPDEPEDLRRALRLAPTASHLHHLLRTWPSASAWYSAARAA